MGDEAKLVWFIRHPSARVWSVNPYKACGIRCVYCIARSQGNAQPWFGPACVVDELRKRLADVPRDTELFVGALVDAYPPEEERLGVTRLALTELSLQARLFCINTKSCLVQRDSDILLKHKGHFDVFMSLCSIDQDLISSLEPFAPSVSDRLETISALHGAGIDVSIDAAPWIPGASDINSILNATPAGVRVQVAPLDIRHIGHEATIAGMCFTQEKINAAYNQHRNAVGNNPRVRWKEPVP